MNEHELLRFQLTPLVEQPEPSTEGDWYVVAIKDLTKWQGIEFHFNLETNKLDMVRLIEEI